MKTGISFKTQHLEEILATKPQVGFLELHPENYMVDGGPRLQALSKLQEHYPLSFHSVSLSLGGSEPLADQQLKLLKEMIGRFQPRYVSDHLAWCKSGGIYFPDLLPLPLNETTLAVVCENVSKTQDVLKRQIFIENPSSYLTFAQSEIAESEFLQTVARVTGCQLLLDLNNIYVSAQNLDYDARDYLDSIPGSVIGEVHLAGHSVDTAAPAKILIDDHGSPVADAVWHLYARLCARVGPVPTLVEWDTRVPELSVLLDEAHKANQILNNSASPQTARDQIVSS